ncbi:MAG: putative sulfate exporter family transporter, partial [Kiritimatiellae bacterium]|nr:putative sulfate exporter family transporter [Kiritimatiellia bacterium]
GVFSAFSKKASRILLQAAVVGIGFGMNFNSAIRSGGAGMAMTVVSVVFVMFAGWVIGRMMRVDGKVSYLVSAGTAICGGSAIAAVAPVVKADDSQISVSLGTIFTLNAIALFIFPPVGRILGLTEIQFGEWAAIAIHDTSSVVGAGAAYGVEALQTATLIKCTRALWILPLAFVTTLIMREKGAKVSIPWFIVFFVLAMLLNTFMPQCEAWTACTKTVVALSKQAMCATLFLIGSTLSLSSLRQVGARALLQGVALWGLTAAASLLIVMR